MMREYSGLRFQTVDTHPAHKGSCLKSVRIKATSFLILTLCSFGWVTAITPDELPLQVEKGEPYTIKQDATTATLYNLERARKLLFSNKKEEVDIDRAAEHLLEAANEGHPEAQYLLGMMFSFGLGALPRSPAHSLVYETFGARGGSMHAIQALAFRRTEGIGVLRDCASGILHYDRVAAHIIHEYETRNLRQAEMFHGEVAARRRLRNHSTRASVTIQDSDVAAFYEHTAANGDSDAMMMLGYAYMYGSWGLTRNGKRAQEYFQRALDKGAGSARGALGALFHRGIDSQEGAVLSNHTLAEAYYQDGYQNYNDTVSQNGLGQMALDRGSTHEAYEHFLSTAQVGNGEGMYQLAMMLRDPDLWLPSSTTDPTNSESSGPRESRLRSSHLRNIRRSVRFLWKAAQQLVLPAIFELARIYGGIMKSDGTLLRTHSATQSNWNNVGGSNEEDSVSSMGSRALQCATSRDLYRTVMYHSIEHQETAKEAEELYESREYIPALIRYLHLSELGYEVGHANAAYLIRSVLSDQDLSMLFLGLSSPGLDGTVSESIASKVHPAPVHSTGPARSNESSIRSIELLQLRQALVVELLEREVHHKSPSAILELGHAYLNGHGVPKSADSARLFYQKASDLGNAEANHSLGYLYHYGIGVPRDYGKALQYYEKAAEMDPAIWWTRHLTRAWVWIEQFRENPRETLIETMHGLWSLLSNRVRLDVSSHKMEGNREGKEKNENVPASENKRPKRTEGNVVPATTQEDGHTEGSSSMPSKDDTQDTHSTIKVKTDDSENQNSTVKGEDASESSKFDSEKLWTALVMLEDFVLWLSIVFVTLLIYIRCTVDMH